jgi:hypothetical protein
VDDRADRLLGALVGRLVEAGLVKQRGRRRIDSMHVLVAVRTLNRLELVGETLRVALEDLAVVAEEWHAGLVTPGWAERYCRPARYDRLPREKDELAAHVLQIGQDGMDLLQAVYAAGAPVHVRALPRIQVLPQAWVQQYWYGPDEQLRWRGSKGTHDWLDRREVERGSAFCTLSAGGRPAPVSACVLWASMGIVTPHDPHARFSHNPGKAAWVGYKDHQSETCDGAVPNGRDACQLRPRLHLVLILVGALLVRGAHG